MQLVPVGGHARLQPMTARLQEKWLAYGYFSELDVRPELALRRDVTRDHVRHGRVDRLAAHAMIREPCAWREIDGCLVNRAPSSGRRERETRTKQRALRPVRPLV